MKILQYTYFKYASNYPWNASDVRNDSNSYSNKYRSITVINGNECFSETDGHEQSNSGSEE